MKELELEAVEKIKKAEEVLAQHTEQPREVIV